MALRWRKNGELLCAAKREEEEGDRYIDDGFHYQLSIICCAIRPEPDERETGRWSWIERPGEYKQFRRDDQ